MPIKFSKPKSLKTDQKDKRKRKMFFSTKSKLSSKTKLKGLRRTVFTDRYSLKDKKGEPMEEYPEQMWLRVSKAIAQFETPTKVKKWEDKFYQIIKDFKFVPAGRILSGAGTGYEVTFFNCYVIPNPEDSRHGIMGSITDTVEIQARAGGVGLNLSTLRPRGARVKKVNGTSSGPVNWASLYSTANHEVIQQGGSRRGALMLMLHDWHPDVEEFITVKKDLTKIPGANLSVCVSDAFMNAVKQDKNWDLVFPDLDDPDYDELWRGDIDDWKSKGKKINVYKTVKAREIWKLISKAAWTSAEPGLHFLERSNKRSNTWYFERLIATNPCGEQPLGEWAVCNLGAMNLSAYVKDGQMDYKNLANDVRVAMRFMDNVINANYYFNEQNYKSQTDIRRTGLGTMGLGDALIKMKIRYGSDESLEVIDKIYKTIRDNAYDTSVDLAKEKGAFPLFDSSKYLKGHFIKNLPNKIKKKIKKNGIRNAVILTQAPTGTTSLLAGVSSGIEPNYDFEFKRKDRTGEHIIYHSLYKNWKEQNPDQDVPPFFVTAKDLTPEEHVKVQAKVQEYTDSSISKTVNAPESYTKEDVDNLYMLAYDLGCKGITFFRDGSREGVLESTSDKEEKKDTSNSEQRPWKRPMELPGSTYKIRTPVGTAFITVNQDSQGSPIEVFINIGRAGSDIQAMAEALGRLISKSLKFGTNLTAKDRAMIIIDQLRGIGGRRSVGFGSNKILSLPDAVAIALANHLGIHINGNGNHVSSHSNGQAEAVVRANTPSNPSGVEGTDSDPATATASLAEVHHSGADICPSCGSSTLVYEEGCVKCHSCGHSEC